MIFKLNLLQKYLLTLLAALLTASSWYISGIILFVGLVPILIVEASCQKFWSKIGFTLLFVTLWTLGITWWVGQAAIMGVVATVVGHVLVFGLMFVIFVASKKKFGAKIGYCLLVLLWLSWEWCHFDTEFQFPWTILGNAFYQDIVLIQFYEYTGVLGGSLWIFAVNLLIFYILYLRYKNGSWANLGKLYILTGVLIGVPMLISCYKFYTYKEVENPCKVGIIQPNIDPYTDKFYGLSTSEQLDIILSLADTVASKNVDYIITPETALTGFLEERYASASLNVETIRNFLREKAPQATFIIGTYSVKYYQQGEYSPTMQQTFSGEYYDTFNSALFIDTTWNMPIAHKSKLVIGLEMFPYPQYLRFLRHLLVDLGEPTGGLGTDKTRLVVPKSQFRAATAICYESVFGENWTKFVKNGANVMFLISNDGWWKNTVGYWQHYNFAKLRAIESRRSVARSANTGISAIVNQKGEIVQETKWWTKDAIIGTLNLNNQLTFYVKHGDYIGKLAAWALVVIYAYLFTKLWLKRSKRVKENPSPAKTKQKKKGKNSPPQTKSKGNKNHSTKKN